MNCVVIGGLLLLLLLKLSAGIAAPVAPPARIKFDSVDFKNVLRWMPPTNSSNVHYDVQWKIYGDAKWRDADDCQGIRRLHCDLSGVTSDLREWYYARLRACSSSASSVWILSPRFSPQWDTQISAPQLRLNASEQGIVVRVRTPKAVAKKMLSSHLRTTLVYHVYVINEEGKEEVFELLCCSGELVVSKVKHKTKYCFQAQSVAKLQGRHSARGPAKCVTAR